jgi:FkbM family methyltransferase
MSSNNSQTRRIRRGQVSFNVVINRDDAYIQNSWNNYESGEWERWSFDMLDTHVSTNTTFLDLGSWLGFMSLHVAARAKRVIAYEADPIAFASVTRNFNANPNWKHIETVNAFVSDQFGTQKVSSLHHGNNSGTTGLVDLGGDSWEVPSIDFGAEIDPIPADSPLFIKMDIEGAEY